MIIKCPKDGSALGQIDARGDFFGVCTKCRCAYGAKQGKLIQKSSRQRAIKRKSKNSSGVYVRDYEFRIRQPQGDLYTLSFSIPGQDDRLQVSRNDFIAIIYQSNSKGHMKTVLRLKNETIGRDQFIASPKTGETVATLLAVLVALMIFVLFSQGNFFLSVFGFLLAAGAGVGLRQLILNMRAIKIDPGEAEKIIEAQSLLSEKDRLNLRLSSLENELRDVKEQFDRLRKLHERMAKVGEKSYESRIKTLKQAGTLSRQNIVTLSKLIEEYSR